MAIDFKLLNALTKAREVYGDNYLIDLAIEEMGEGYSKVLRGSYSLYNNPVEFMQAYKENKLSEIEKTAYEEKFQTVLTNEVKEIKDKTDLTEMLKGDASYYYLTADIDCTGLDWSNIERDTTTVFQAILDGYEHCIKGLPDYLFYNFQGRVQNIAFTDMQAGASICKIAKGGAMSNVFLHGEVIRDADGGLFACEINAYKGSGLYYLLFDNVTIVTTNTAQSGYHQGFVAGYASAKNMIECRNSVFISKLIPIKIRTEKDSKGNSLYVDNLGEQFSGFFSGTYIRCTSANQFEREYDGMMTSLNQKYYELTKVLEEEAEPDFEEDGDALVFDSAWTK